MSKSIYDVEFCDKAGEDDLRKACKKMQEDNARLLQSHEYVQDWNDKFQDSNNRKKVLLQEATEQIKKLHADLEKAKQDNARLAQAIDIDLIKKLNGELNKANDEVRKLDKINNELLDALEAKHVRSKN